MKGLTTIAALPGSGSGCMSSLPPEKTASPKVQMRAAYFEEALQSAETAPEAVITEEGMDQLGRNLERMRSKGTPDRQGFEPFGYTERS